jgi:hypothetical protein|tara:strand:- start:344 stop:631 length:288 start_codon:yes stop_codon:yes gene_type:complete
MVLFWFQVGFGLFVILILIALGIKSLKERKNITDEKIIRIVRKKLLQDDHYHFELISIITIDKITTVIVNVGYQEIALEIDNESGIICSVERIAR